MNNQMKIRNIKNNKSPKFAQWLLSKTINDADRDTILGDFEEFYREQILEKGRFNALVWYWNQVNKSFPLFLSNFVFWSIVMLKNYFKVGLRNIIKSKVYSVINILGLSIGLACSILMFFFVRDELTYDSFHNNAEEIYEVYASMKFGEHTAKMSAQMPLGPVLPAEFPEVVSSARISKEKWMVKYKQTVMEEKVYVTEPSFFKIFSFPIKYGNKENVISDFNSVVITKRTAVKYFGSENMIGNILSIKVNGTYSDFVVTGIVENIPGNSSLIFDLAINIENVYGDELSDWKAGRRIATIIQLSDNKKAEMLVNKFQGTINEHLKILGVGDELKYNLQSLTEYHLNGKFTSILENKGKIEYSYILSGIAVLVLLIACFNFMNLSVGNASTRLKEIGIRKVLGAKKKQLIRQFWFESVVISFFALVIGIILAELFLPTFNFLSQKSLQLDYLSSIPVITGLIGLAIFVGLTAGSYPAFVLSGFRSVDLFKGKLRFTEKNVFTKALIVLQFSISIFLMISTAVMLKQNSFIAGADLGFNTDQVIIIPTRHVYTDSEKRESFVLSLKNRLVQYENIINVSAAECVPTIFSAEGLRDKNNRSSILFRNTIDYDYLAALDMEIVEGRVFSRDFPSDAGGSILVNETFAETFNEKSPVGKRFSDFYATSEDYNPEIIGVVKDFHYRPLLNKIEPAYLELSSGKELKHIIIKIKRNKIQGSLNVIKKEFLKIAPNTQFLFSFLDDEVSKQYVSVKRWNRIIQFASLFAILIACSGLFGLTLLTVVRRSKEFGIRKVLGASNTNIVNLVNREFLKLVLTANFISWPAAYFIMTSWLQDYAYRTSMGPEVFLLSGTAAMLIAIITISLQAVKAAYSNPAEILKCE